ncbi:hypothetical protein Ahy_B10g101713 isoform E [Arachis hypogaea]|uniref:SMP-LTD domain-containing protein n=1 Tax=Arachis hypogaea TaxID=3818 RepID=A0A444X0G1_ARAHY|nr:hypothetical protein Ahy_B10g101713 isoform E [Arachis hypogaea]
MMYYISISNSVSPSFLEYPGVFTSFIGAFHQTVSILGEWIWINGIVQTFYLCCEGWWIQVKILSLSLSLGMDITEVTILHHVGIVLMVMWLLSAVNYFHPFAYFVALIYLYLVHELYVTRLRKKVQFEERKQANQRRVLSDSETVRWLNHAVENIWPICMENIASQNILLPIIPWFLEKYKPWTAKEAVVQHLYLGRNPPLFNEIRVLRQNDDDHLVLELGMNFLTADDMSAILAVKLRKRLGFGMTAKLHITGMHVEGKVLVGVKFLRTWPFIGRLRVCFVEPPYFQMTVKPIFTHGLDVTELPGIAGWLDKLLSIAFEQTLVEPNMLVVDVEKFVTPQEGNICLLFF